MRLNPARTFLAVFGLALVGMTAACGSARNAYYDVRERMGYAKRERLVDDVRDARDEQVEAKKEFANALEQFRSVVAFQGGDLEKTYDKLNGAYEKATSEAEDVRGRVKTVKNVAQALFDEWRREIAEMKDDPSLQRSSRQIYDDTRRNYDAMIGRMDVAVGSMDRVLERLHNRVLFLKHNLNAQAIASLRGTEIELGADVERLIKEMEASIAEADSFLAQMDDEA